MNELPLKWYVKVTPQNADVLTKWKKTTKWTAPANTYETIMFEGVGSPLKESIKAGYTEISFEDFKRLVLKENMYTIEQIKEQKIAVKCSSKEEGHKIAEALSSKFFNDYWKNFTFWNCNNFSIFYNHPNLKWSNEKNTPNWFTENKGFATKYINFNQVIFKEMKNQEIVGYKTPYDLFNGKIKKGTIYKETKIGDNIYACPEGNISSESVAFEIAQTWEPVYKLKEEIYCMGKFELLIKKEGIFHNKTENITKFVEKLVSHYSRLDFGGYKALQESVTFKSTGCQSNVTNLSDWRIVLEKYQKMQ